MKIADSSKLLLLSLVLCFGVTACKSPKGLTPIPNRSAQAPKNDTPAGPETLGTPTNTRDTTSVQPLKNTGEGVELGNRPTDLSKYDQDRDTFKQDTIYFDFDKYNVKPSELSKAQAVANYLKGQNADSVLVEGHCDERGTPEYNRALGERRALSVREVLINEGVAADRIHTLSYGEDKPADPGHDEAAWRKNRRGEFVLLHPKAGGAGGENR